MFKKVFIFLMVGALAFPLAAFASTADTAGFVVREETLPASDAAARPDELTPDESTTTFSIVRDGGGPVNVGDIIEVSVLADPHGNSINTVAAVLQYPTDLLDPVATDYDGSDFSLFMDDADAPPASDTVSVVALQPYPGISEKSTVASFTFRVKKTGAITFEIASDTETYANDGLGTETGIDSQPLTIATP